MLTTEELTQELETVRLAQNGDAAAQSRLVMRYSSRIYSLALRLTGSHQDAEDVLQETFLTMLKKINQFQGNSSFYTWLYRVAINIGLRKLKSKPRRYTHVSIDDPDIRQISATPDEHWPAVDFSRLNEARFRQKLDQALAKLPEIYRTVFILRDLHELSTEETSNILNLTESNTKIRLMRARNFLKSELEHLIASQELT